jgi:hypothetical protein
MFSLSFGVFGGAVKIVEKHQWRELGIGIEE